MKRTVVIIMAITILTTSILSANFSGGTGSKSDPYQITTLTQLDSVSHHLDKSFILMNNLDFEGSPFDSANSTNNEGWLPIGNYENKEPFEGCFDGNGYVLSNLFINRNGGGIGLIGGTSKAEIKNLKLTNVNVQGKYNVGTLIGYNYNVSTTSNCSS